jgi:hypothetical protein
MTVTITASAPPASLSTGQNTFVNIVPTLSQGANAVTLILPVVAFTGTPNFAATTEVVSGTTVYDISCSGVDCQGTSAFQYTPLASNQFNWGYNTTSLASGGLTSTVTARNTCTLQEVSAICSMTTQAAATDAPNMSIFGSGEAEEGTYAVTSYVVPLTGVASPSTSGSSSGETASSKTSSSSGQPSTSSNNAEKKGVGAILTLALLVAALLT